MRPNPYAGYEPDTLARMKAANENLAGIIAGRRTAARALLSRNRRAAQQVYDDTAALRPGPVPPSSIMIPVWIPVGEGIGGAIVFHGHGAPESGDTLNAHPGDVYLDVDTGDLYQLTSAT